MPLDQKVSSNLRDTMNVTVELVNNMASEHKLDDYD